MKKVFFSIIFFLCFQNIFSQTIFTSADNIHSSFRGLSVVNDKVVWVSGSDGMVGKSVDAGKTWNWITVKGFEKIEFRDIEAFDENTAIIMGVADPAYILRTADGGKTWKVVYENHTKGIFLDAMEFWNKQNGIIVGDPIDGRFFIIRTFDGGKSWKNIPEEEKPLADSGEACFASSGTNIRTINKSEAVFVSGGLTSHVFVRNKKVLLPLLQGKESTGANSIAVKNERTMVVVGGDFLERDLIKGNCAFTNDGGNTWHLPKSSPAGYRSCIEYLSKSKWITCGLNGVDISNDDGMNWQKISDESFNVCRKAKNGTAVYFAGNGRIGKLKQ